jgi:sulfate adenylyltransferase subunit 1 (EFTu-like GTPase family)
LVDEIDTRGDMLAVRDGSQVADQFAAHLWMSNDALRLAALPMKITTTGGTVTDLHHRLDIDTLSKLAAKTPTQRNRGRTRGEVPRSTLMRRTARRVRSFSSIGSTIPLPLQA